MPVQLDLCLDVLREGHTKDLIPSKAVLFQAGCTCKQYDLERTLNFRRLFSREKLAARLNHPEAIQPGGYYHNPSITVMLLSMEEETKGWEHAMMVEHSF